jgi:hypothetical protein
MKNTVVSYICPVFFMFFMCLFDLQIFTIQFNKVFLFSFDVFTNNNFTQQVLTAALDGFQHRF